jgi:hypothetical protein
MGVAVAVVALPATIDAVIRHLLSDMTSIYCGFNFENGGRIRRPMIAFAP